MMPTFFLDLFTGATWERFHEAGAEVSGFRESRWSTVNRMRPGDVLLCYLTGVGRFVGILDVISDGYRDDTRIWDNELFPARVKVRPRLVLTPETGVPVKSLRDQLSWFRDEEHPIAWTGRVRGSPTKIQESDARAIVAAVEEAKRSPVVRPVDPKLLKRTPRTYTAHLGPVEQEVTVPEERDERVDANGMAGPAPRWQVSHEEIQWLLLKLGSDMGLDVWVARNDRSKAFNGFSFQEFKRLRSDLPRQFDEATTKTIELIDVIWLQKNTFVAAFEIEHTTAIYSGLLRMSDLVAMQPNLNIPLYLVAPDERRDKVFVEINRPTFSRMSPPLSTICQYMPYSRLREFVERLGDYARHLKPNFLDEIAEVWTPSV